jgi:hypothetical protein
VQQWKSKILDPTHSADIDRDGDLDTDDLLRIVREWKVDIAP